MPASVYTRVMPLLFACGQTPAALVEPPAPATQAAAAADAPTEQTPPPQARPTAPPWTPPPDRSPREPPLTVAGAAPERCTIRLAGSRILVDGDDATRTQTVAICRNRKAAMVELGDDHDEAIWRALKSDLATARIPILVRGQRGDGSECWNNPLAKGCM